MNLTEMFDIRGKVALVTGGGRGIGKAIAEVYLEAGAKVAFTGRRLEWLEPTEAEFKAKGYDCLSIVADVSKQEDVQRTFRTTIEKYGQIDILVNNAGQTWGQPTEEMPLAKWQQIIDVNLTGLFLTAQIVGQHMLARGDGHIINIASILGMGAADLESTATTAAYNASKAAVVNFTKTLGKEWARRGIVVNAIAPGWFPTRMAKLRIDQDKERFESQIPLGRVGDVEELKGVALLLASPAASYIIGQTLIVDGGLL